MTAPGWVRWVIVYYCCILDESPEKVLEAIDLRQKQI